jgi:hypothetical protein
MKLREINIKYNIFRKVRHLLGRVFLVIFSPTCVKPKVPDMRADLRWPPSLRSHSSMCIAIYRYCRCQDVIGQKKAVIHSPPVTRDKHRKETERRELRSGQPLQYLNNMSHGQNSAPSQVNHEAEPSAQYFLKIEPLESSMGRHKAA